MKKRYWSIFVILFLFGIICGVKFYLHEYGQKVRIATLESEIMELSKDIEDMETGLLTLQQTVHDISEKGVNKLKTWSTGNYNYFAIGNSITIHGKCDYWWNVCGMAASTLENDYVHQLGLMIAKDLNGTGGACPKMKNQKDGHSKYGTDNRFDTLDLASSEAEKSIFGQSGGGLDLCAFNLSSWETQSKDRAEMLSQLDGYLDDRINLVTIQLGENAVDLNTFESDFVELVGYVKERCPIAQIVIVGDFWDYGERDEMKASVASQ